MNGVQAVYGGITISSIVVHAEVLCSVCAEETTNTSLICDKCQKDAETTARKAVEKGDLNV